MTVVHNLSAPQVVPPQEVHISNMCSRGTSSRPVPAPMTIKNKVCGHELLWET